MDDAGKILRIPLARTPHDDLLVWGGEYSVRLSVIQIAIGVVKELKQSTMFFVNVLSRWNSPCTRGASSVVDCGLSGEKETEECMSRRTVQGVVVRNEEGLVLFSCSEIHHEVFSAFAAEAIACRKAIQVGVEQQWQKMIIEGDSLTIIKKCVTKSQDRSHIRAYIHDIKQSLNRSSSFIFKHTLRSANALSHIIAMETLKREEETYMEMGVLEYAEVQQRIDRRREPD
ncbi:hypothetical protein CXB51_021844 [Gossypium anomalum]|uniref:RNase H type-1 domain-containing protein n=1 Tax=Gossypium anomalum TaxID=47600 RepID=A0A8J5YML9_9ROSI|nr:hypothetical protein CXB51_021844 [Gossypium anomalum]